MDLSKDELALLISSVSSYCDDVLPLLSRHVPQVGASCDDTLARALALRARLRREFDAPPVAEPATTA